jgi:hypothetical protein
MAHRWLQPSNYSAFSLFLIAGVFAGLFAWTSFNLLHLAMANFRFIGEYGQMAVMDGGAQQFLGILLYGYLSLAFYLSFKTCEVELVHRWREWRNK